MGNQGKMERNSKVCKKFQTMKSIHDMQFWVFLFSKTEDIPLKVRQNKFGKNGCCRNYFIKKSFCHRFPVIPKAQNYRECMETKKAIFRYSKERIPSVLHIRCDHELISLVYEVESL